MMRTARALGRASISLILALACVALPAIASAQAVVLIDAIPTGAQVIGAGPGTFAYQDLDQVDPAIVKRDLVASVEHLQAMAAEKSATFICLLSAYGDDAREFRFGDSDMKIRLSVKHPQLYLVLFKGGTQSTPRITYRTTGSPAEPQIKYQVKKVSIPVGTNIALYLFFNLTRLQVDAAKAGASEIYIAVTGTGKASAVMVPGLSTPLTIYDGDMTLTESWSTANAVQFAPSGASGDPMTSQ